MNFKLLAEVVLGILTLSIGGSFWAIVKSPKHLRMVLDSATELQDLMNFLG